MDKQILKAVAWTVSFYFHSLVDRPSSLKFIVHTYVAMFVCSHVGKVVGVIRKVGI